MNPHRPHAAAPMLAALALAACAPAAAPPPVLTVVYVSPAQAAPAEESRLLMGTVAARAESPLGFRVGGQVETRRVELGQAVVAGTLLAQLDPKDLRLAREAAAAQREAAEAEAAQAARDAARFAGLAAEGSMPAAEAERQQARAEAAEARLAQARRQEALAREREDHALLRAPFDGVVTATRAEPGQVVAEGQPVLHLARGEAAEIQADLPETLAAELGRHQAHWLPEGAAPVPLRLRELAASAHPGTRTFRARFVPVGGLPPGWKLGRSTVLRLSRPVAAAGVRLPAGALLKAAGPPQVWVVEAEGRLRAVPVTLRAQDGETVVVEGLQDGQPVVTVGAHKLDAGMRVRPVPRPLAAEGAR